MKHLLPLLAVGLLFFAATISAETVLTVASDGTAKFKTVQEAIMSVPSGTRDNPVIIRISPGIYRELLYVQREKRYFKLIGENPTNTILTYNLYAGITNAEGKPIGTFKTPSTTIDADDFTAENLTFENSAGAVGQALAIRVDGDRASFRNCRFLGWQDTILLNRGRQYFENCYVAGHVDFIFGAATAWFEQCKINCLGSGYITAASTPADVPFGFVFSHCKITGAPEVKTYLGRPWRTYASTIYLNCEMSAVVRPEGWHDWKKTEAHATIRYAEFNSTGAGANQTNRADWTKPLSTADAKKITPDKVLAGADGWNPTLPVLDSKVAANRFDISYGEASGQELLLDAHVPAGDGKFPIILIVHGGGWSGGDKETDIVPVLAPFTTNFTWFTINYRLAPTNRWPACFDDVLTAIRWVKAHAAEFKGDPKRLALMGYSAGGQLALLAGAMDEKGTRVQAVIGLAPPADVFGDATRRGLDKWSSMKNLLGATALDEPTLALMKKISPVEYVRPGLPPFLLIQGNTDQAVAYDFTVAFVEKLRAAQVPCEFITLTNANHRIAEWNKFDPAWQTKLVQWLNEKLAAK